MKTFFVGIKGIIHDKEKGVLLLKRENPTDTFWDTPGGRMDDDENFRDTLSRELGEELPGIASVEIGELLGAHRVHRDIEGDISLVLLYFSVTASLPEPLQLSEEHDGYVWVTSIEEIPEGVNNEVQEIIRKILSPVEGNR